MRKHVTDTAFAIHWMLMFVILAGCSADDSVASPWQEPPSLELDLRVTVSPSEVDLLQPVTVTVDRFRKQGVEVSFAAAVPDTDFVTEAVESEEERAYGDGFWQRTTLTLLPIMGPGELKLPAFKAESIVSAGEVALVATTPEQTILVTSTLAPEHGEAIEAPGDLFPAPFQNWGWLLLLAVLATIGVFARLLWSRRKQHRQLATVPVPAHVKALRELLLWKAAPRVSSAELDAFYVGVSQVLRVYLEERFGLHAPERTTEEFLHDLDSSAQLVRDHASELRRFLSQCDLVKFAKFVPTDADHETTYDLAESFVESTRADRVQSPGSNLASQKVVT